ncbi:MAG: hypothetical protein HYW50_05125, partial [Candidatus Diapherotrites archaeon]|nr:hypothetical protein [Candidatus Diapherotrites archaeon]
RTGKTGLAIIFPELDFLIQRNLSPQMAQEFDQMLKHFSETEIGFAASEVKELDLPEEIENIAEVKANIIEKNDAGIQLKGRQSYRVFLRPALSACTEG